jgi:hypothetical protein
VVLGDLDEFLSNIRGPTPQHVQHPFVKGRGLSGRRDHFLSGRDRSSLRANGTTASSEGSSIKLVLCVLRCWQRQKDRESKEIAVQ